MKALIAKIELGEGDAGHRLRDRRQGVRQGQDDRRPRHGQRARRPTTASSSRRRRTPAAARAFLDWFAGPDGQAILGGSRVPAAGVVIDPSRGLRPGVPGTWRVDRGRPRPGRAAGASARSPRSPACSRSSSGCRSLALVVRAILDGSLQVALASPVVLEALWLSLVTTAISLVITVALGLPLAIVLARRRFRGKGWLEAIVDLPIVLPPSVAGLALLLVFGRRGPARRRRSRSSASRCRSRRWP